ncbi:MAG: ArsA family ATPase [Betaproteobacteria bacterium]
MLLTLLDRQVVFFGGKGGVGKTTSSSAFALAASRRGKRVLLVSTDPAHSISDIFDRPVGGAERELAPRLSAVEIDAAAESLRYIAGVKREIERMFSAAVIRQAHRQIDMAAASPGLAEVALLDRMIDLIVEREPAYDLIVFDTAPTGHTLQLLRMPEAMTTWIQALVRHRKALLEIDAGGEGSVQARTAQDPVLASLERRHARLQALRDRIVDRGRTSFVLVTIPERLAIEETARAYDLLREAGLDIGAVIVNRILPEGLDGEFYRSRKGQERTYLDEIVRRFPRAHRVEVHQLARDVYGLEPLMQIARQLLPEATA